MNSFSRQNLQLISSDLGYQWFEYQGSNIETTRDFCEAMKKKRYVHISEFEDVIHGRFPEFKAIEGKINPKTKLPYGFKEDTTAGNFPQVRGGWNCGHQLRPVAEEDVPLSIRNEVYASAAYQKWKSINEPAKDDNKNQRKEKQQIKQNKKSILEKLAEELPKEIKLSGYNEKMRISKNGLRHALNRITSSLPLNEKLELLNNLSSLFKNSNYLRFEEDYKNRLEIKGVHIFETIHNGKKYEILFREDLQNTTFYDIR